MVDRVVMIHLSVRLPPSLHIAILLTIRTFVGYAIPSISATITNDKQGWIPNAAVSIYTGSSSLDIRYEWK
jgi:hypothetical protein